MKRYCDYDYDNNCIILFDAFDAEKDDELNIRWISSGSDSEQKENIKPKQQKNKKKKLNEKEGEKVPLYQYLEIKHQKRMQERKQRILKKAAQKYIRQKKAMQQHQHQQPIQTMPAYQNIHPYHQHHQQQQQQLQQQQQHHFKQYGGPRSNNNQQNNMNNFLMNMSMQHVNHLNNNMINNQALIQPNQSLYSR